MTARTAVEDRAIHDELVLGQIKDAYSADYDIGPADGGGYIAVHLGVHPLRPVGTLEELDSLIRAHYWRWISR